MMQILPSSICLFVLWCVVACRDSVKVMSHVNVSEHPWVSVYVLGFEGNNMELVERGS